MGLERSPRQRIAREYRDYIHYELAVRRHVIALRIGVVLAIVLGIVNLALHVLARVG